jgi:hypothetical protein
MARLVGIGDSLMQGFQSLAITHTERAFPALIAECMGMPAGAFRAPSFQGAGGLPCSLEWLARRLEQHYGANLNAFEWVGALLTIPSLLDEVEDYWERGPGSQALAPVDYHNLAVWGFEAADAYQIDPTLCLEQLRRPKDNLLALPSEPRLRTAYRVLNPSQDPELNRQTQITIAERIQEQEGGIDHLLVTLGANNCLATVVELKIHETGATPPGPNTEFTLWSPEAFEKDYAQLARRLKGIGARHTYVSTVPHVTIPPITRGVMANGGPLPAGAKYFDYYTRFFIGDENFAAARDPHLTGAEVRHIDEYIDQYNLCIRRHANEQGFHVVDLCDLLDRLAVRRNHGALRYTLPPALADLSVLMFGIEPSGRVGSGGLISLDGVHPTSCGYALVAQHFIDQMKPYEAGLRDVDFAAVRSRDTLVSSAPRTLDDLFGALGTLEKHFHLSRWLAKGFMRKR